jgi:hypothetical protein
MTPIEGVLAPASASLMRFYFSRIGRARFEPLLTFGAQKKYDESERRIEINNRQVGLFFFCTGK